MVASWGIWRTWQRQHRVCLMEPCDQNPTARVEQSAKLLRSHQISKLTQHLCSSADVRQVYLDSDEGNVVKLFDETSHLLTISIIVKPRTSLDLHLWHGDKGNTQRTGFLAPQLSAALLNIWLQLKKGTKLRCRTHNVLFPVANKSRLLMISFTYLQETQV